MSRLKDDLNNGDRISVADFSNLLTESVVGGMTKVLGESGFQAVFYHLNLNQCLRNPKEIHTRLDSMFRSGCASLERAILEQLCEKCKVTVDMRRKNENFDFVRYVRMVREAMQ